MIRKWHQLFTPTNPMAQETLLIAANPPEIKLPPTQDELLSDDGIPMETQRHGLQMQLLVRPLSQWLKTQGREAFVAGNMFVYFSPNQVMYLLSRGQFMRAY
jgi:hypothetical protein